MPTVDEIVQSEAPRASVKPVGAEPNLLIEPRSELAAAVPVPLVVPPADSTVMLIELSIVPVTVRVALLVAANADEVTASAAMTSENIRKRFMKCTLLFFLGLSATCYSWRESRRARE